MEQCLTRHRQNSLPKLPFVLDHKLLHKILKLIVRVETKPSKIKFYSWNVNYLQFVNITVYLW